MRRFPNCALLIGAVLLTAGEAADHPIHSHARLEVPQTFSFNLDWGIWGYNTAEARGDFRYEATNATTRDLRAVSPAGLAVGGDKPVGYEGCSIAHFSQDAIRVEALKEGTFLCCQDERGADCGILV